MEQKKIDRINELAKTARLRPLTEEELSERDALRREYIDAMKASLTRQLDNTVIIRPDGTHQKLKRNK